MLRVGVKGYKSIRERAEAEVGKTILYGPNGSGKTSLMEVVHAVISGDASRISAAGLRDDFSLDLAGVGGATYELKKEGPLFYLLRGGAKLGEYVDLGNALSALRKVSGLEERFRVVAWVDPCGMSVSGGDVGGIDICKHDYDSLELLSPEQLRGLRPMLRLMLDASAPVRARDPYSKGQSKPTWWVELGEEGWVRLQDLPYGDRRALLTLVATEIADAVFIEGFEAGMHGDHAIALLDTVGEWGKTVLAETHHGGVFAHALARGWSAYYVEEGKVRKVEKAEDLRNAELYWREIREYTTESDEPEKVRV